MALRHVTGHAPAVSSRTAPQRWLVVLALLVAAGLGDARAMAEPAGPRELVIDTSERMLTALKAERELIRKEPRYVYRLVQDIVLPHFDFQAMSRWVLGKYWRSASAEQRERFTNEFRTLLVRTYAVSLAEYSDQKVSYDQLQAAADATDVMVRTTVERTGAYPITIAYSMHFKDGKWLVYDVSIDGVSLVANYRTTFASEMRQGDVDDLIKKLAERNRQAGS